jgi:hypothetical protein
MTRWIAVSSGRARAQSHSEIALNCAPACRVVTSIYYLRLKRRRPAPASNLYAPRVNSRDPTVPDNHNKFAIAVTRARVDSRAFFSVSPPLCAPRISALRGIRPVLRQNQCQVGKTQSNPTVTLSEAHSYESKLYALSMKIPCRICRTSTRDCATLH